MKGIIIGAGIGGLSTAIALRKQKIEVAVYEVAKELNSIGTGILLPPNAMKILERYGLAEEIRSQGNSIHSLDVTDTNGKRLASNPATLNKYQTIAIHRGTLQQILLKALPEYVIHTATKCEGFTDRGREVTAHLSGKNNATANFLIGSDGLHSSIRKQCMPESTLRSANQICWRGIANFSLSRVAAEKLTEIWGRGIRFGYVCIGQNKTYWYATKVHKSSTMLGAEISIQNLLKIYKNFPEIVKTILKKTPNTEIYLDALTDLRPLERWYSGNVVLLGDAAHASTPNLGQGGAQAIEDAWVLSQCLASQKSISKAFNEFESIRIPRAHKITNISWTIGRLTNMTGVTACAIRNTIFRSTPQFVANHQSRFLYDVPY